MQKCFEADAASKMKKKKIVLYSICYGSLFKRETEILFVNNH